MNRWVPMILTAHQSDLFRPRRSALPERQRRAFTLVELLVVIAIIGVLIGMAVPAMQNMRELSRRSNCQQNLLQVSLALSAYATRNGHYPIGTVNDTGPIRSEAIGFHHNWISGILPMLDSQNVYDAIDRRVSVYDKANDPVRALRMPVLRCPSATDVRDNTTSYAGMSSSVETPIDVSCDGVFFLNTALRDSDILDGLGYTIFVGEQISDYAEDLGWISGTRSSLRTAGHAINDELKRLRGERNPANAVGVTYVGGLASDHAGGAYVLMGSGECRFRSTSTDREVLRQLTARADGSLPKESTSDDPLIRAKKPKAAAAGSGARTDGGSNPKSTSGDESGESPTEVDEAAEAGDANAAKEKVETKTDAGLDDERDA